MQYYEQAVLCSIGNLRGKQISGALEKGIGFASG